MLELSSIRQKGGPLHAEVLSQLTDLDKVSDWCFLFEGRPTPYLPSGLVTKHADRNYAKCSKHWSLGVNQYYVWFLPSLFIIFNESSLKV